MADRNRSGKRLPREQLSKKRIPELGYYIIVTDSKETEQNYIHGLRDSIPEELQGKLAIKVARAKTVDLVSEAENFASQHRQYAQPWIVFDRDQVSGFDQIISLAEARGIKVGWSNPCIEIWFSAYFGEMPVYQNSTGCCRGFGQKYLEKTRQEYKKSDTIIYSKLCHFGNEKQAIKIAEQKHAERTLNCNDIPSRMCPCTTLHTLVKEIKEKI